MGGPSAIPFPYQSLSFGDLPTRELKRVRELRLNSQVVDRFLEDSGRVVEVPKRMDDERPLVAGTVQAKRDEIACITHLSICTVTRCELRRISSCKGQPILQ